MKRYKSFTVTGVTNTTTWDAGIRSTEAEPKRILGVMVSTSRHIGNHVKGEVEREEVVDLLDYNLDTTEQLGTANVMRSTTKIGYIEIGVALLVGEEFRLGIACGGTASNLYGSYVYEITK